MENVRDCSVDAETFVEYYMRRFNSDLRVFFDVTNEFGDGSYPFVREMPSGVTNLRRQDLVWDGLSHCYMFSVAVFYMSMCAQVVGRLYGYHQMEDFLRATGWPMFSCGMGGLMHPIQVMKESGLSPASPEDGYMKTLSDAGRHFKEVMLGFRKKRMNANDLSELFDQQQSLYCEWIKDHKTEYESYFVAYPVDHMPKLHIHEYLNEYKEDVPQWLADYKPGDHVDFSEFVNSRLGYYPGARYDANLINVCSKSHSVHCFLNADYGVSREHMEEYLNEDLCLEGYHVIGRVDWSDTVRVDGNRWFFEDLEPYCLMAVFERDDDRDESWGAKRLAVTYILADAIKTYREMFVKRYRKAPWIVLLQDHGFGGNYDKFGRGGRLSSIVERGVKPEFVICGDNTRIWKGYYKMDRILPTSRFPEYMGGASLDARYLYTLNYGNLFYR